MTLSKVEGIGSTAQGRNSSFLVAGEEDTDLSEYHIWWWECIEFYSDGFYFRRETTNNTFNNIKCEGDARELSKEKIWNS